MPRADVFRHAESDTHIGRIVLKCQQPIRGEVLGLVHLDDESRSLRNPVMGERQVNSGAEISLIPTEKPKDLGEYSSAR
jgi:hypothetical protein